MEKEGEARVKARRDTIVKIMGLKEFVATKEGTELLGKKLATKTVEIV
jgi:hypothetical protein